MAAKRRGQYIDSDKCGVSWSPLTNHQWPGAFSRHPLLLPPTDILQKSKVPFFHFTVGPCLFHFIWHSWRSPRVAKFKSVCYTIRERESERERVRERDIFCFFVEWEEILKRCAMVPQRFWKVVRGFCQQSVWEPVHWRPGLHVASIQNGELPHPTCEYLFSITIILKK